MRFDQEYKLKMQKKESGAANVLWAMGLGSIFHGAYTMRLDSIFCGA